MSLYLQCEPGTQDIQALLHQIAFQRCCTPSPANWKPTEPHRQCPGGLHTALNAHQAHLDAHLDSAGPQGDWITCPK